MIDDEVTRAARLLETMMKMAGINRQELDRRMAAGRGYASQVLSGRMELKYRHILAMLQALDVHPATFFGILHPPPESPGSATTSERLLTELRRAGFGDRRQALPAPSPAPLPPIDPDDLDRRIRIAVREALERAGNAPPAGGGESSGT